MAWHGQRCLLALLPLALLPLSAANDLLKAIDGNNPSQINMALKSTHPKLLKEVDASGTNAGWEKSPHPHVAVMREAAAPTCACAGRRLPQSRGRELTVALPSSHPGMTPLMTAVTNGKHKVIKALLKAGADTTIANADGYSVMHVAADLGRDRVIQVRHGRARTGPQDRIG